MSGYNSTFHVQSSIAATGAFSSFAIDPLTLAITECMAMSSAMRKVSRYQQSGMAAILGSGNDFFGGTGADDDSLTTNLGFAPTNRHGSHGPPHPNGTAHPSTAMPLVSSFVQLRSMLSEATDIEVLDSLTVLQPFLLVVKSPSTSGRITAMALEAISRFLQYGVLTDRSPNLGPTLGQICSALTHCRFEAADQSSDDAVLLKVLRLMEAVATSPHAGLLPNDVVSEVVQTCLSLACNKKRSEVLRRAAEMAIGNITARIFARLSELPEQESGSVVVGELPEDVIGAAAARKESDLAEDDRVLEDKDSNSDDGFDVSALIEFTSILISMISPSNQYQHMESTRVLALRLINTAVEVSGHHFYTHPSLMSLFTDPVSKHVLQIIATVESPALLEVAWRVFATMAVVLGPHLKSQIELTFSASSSVVAGSTFASPTAKEMFLESLSLLWTRDPYFFTRLYADYDCDFDRADLARQLIEFICTLALPESARVSTDNVPPLCLEGLLSFVNGINERVKKGQFLESSSDLDEVPRRLSNKANKKAFVECTDEFNKKPSLGLAALVRHGFIKDPNDIAEVSQFMYNKSGRLNKKVLGEYLAKSSNKDLLKHFMSLFDYEGLRVDEAIRLLLKTFRLPGEAQQIERIVETFASRYAECQEEKQPDSKEADQPDVSTVRPDEDSVFVLSFSIILLNTDLHNPQVKKHMTLEAYKKNLRGQYNGGDNYPEWYLSKIYSSIRDREIIMPEEHHGTEKWFDDVWNNVVSAEALANNDLHEEVIDDISVYDKNLFADTVGVITKTLVQIFNEATDDHIITRLMSTIDKSVNICLQYGILEPVDLLIGLLADLTTLTDPAGLKRNKDESDDNLRDEIPITQIKLEGKDDTITVSDVAVWFGRDFKAQIATVVLFRLLKKTKCRVTPAWEKVIKIILTLYESCLVDPNMYSEFQKTLSLPSLTRAKPRYIINRSKPLRESGLLSTFSSFLKGYSDEPPEPTDSEVESTLSTIDCVKSLDLVALFKTVAEGGQENKILLAQLLVDAIPEKLDDVSKRYYESEVLFITENSVFLALLSNDKLLFKKIIQKISKVGGTLSKKGDLRMAVYELVLWKELSTLTDDPSAEDEIVGNIELPLGSVLSLDKDILTKFGEPLISPLISLVSTSSTLSQQLLSSKQYWKVLRSIGAIPVFSSKVLGLTESLIKESVDDISPENFMLVLGLLDEISSVGAFAAQWEQDSSNHAKAQGKEDKSKYLRELINTSKKSIALTSELSYVFGKDGFTRDNAGYPLVQALAHQCFNPCREVRSTALNTLKSTVLTAVESHDNQLPPAGLFQFGLFPLLGELAKPSVIQTDPQGFVTTQVEALSLCSKVFLHFIGKFSEEEIQITWIGILDGFKSFDDIQKAATTEDNSANHESGMELLKNMLLVLQSGGVLSPENKELWEPTWTKVSSIYSELRPESEAKEEPADTTATGSRSNADPATETIDPVIEQSAEDAQATVSNDTDEVD
ncbi:GDP/GTP exchange factor for [Yamadazyma tenuis ATCC 10573]|uniref:GDP/GTP exchange factor for n=1 Tax=Candida tenuis (strain ATCC 10573 / BCRC 21748 / CBS 615 / JCM 9827 / NBRC 10315 / NRRL Y-1498 / VKM Y-70) TaxID=590646 RepID=G3AXP4_CANTC|nr:GDP/GTP exchange factor for [Yamadazyma tenuis ATCC 10573]EGV65665.1 GDP/GTP exchange factor for [Yamadazyma tenuis ATCC 10573]